MCDNSDTLYGSVRVRTYAGQKTIANIVLHGQHPCICCPPITEFSGAIIDRCTGNCIPNVDISISFGSFSAGGITDKCGRFHFSLPCGCQGLSISINKQGFTKRYIGFYPVTKSCGNNFYLFRK